MNDTRNLFHLGTEGGLVDLHVSVRLSLSGIPTNGKHFRLRRSDFEAVPPPTALKSFIEDLTGFTTSVLFQVERKQHVS